MIERLKPGNAYACDVPHTGGTIPEAMVRIPLAFYVVGKGNIGPMIEARKEKKRDGLGNE